jgi:NAD(P)-dependent dehydrogenase (short-subunit alcohol dehydrogenase family)
VNGLEGRVAVVTGSAQGLGRASARALAAAGAAVLVTDVNGEGAQAVADELTATGARATARVLDVRDPAACAAVMQAAVDELGALHVLHNNAGVAWPGRDGLVHRIEPEVWDDVIRINLSGTFYCCHYAIPHMRAGGGGSIVNTASSMAVLPNGTLDAYAASKGGVAALTRSMAMGVGRRGIRVNAICPGYADTPANALIFDDAEQRAAFERGHATGLQTPDEIADLVVFLAGDASRSLTGAVLTCDRGWTSFKLPDTMRGTHQQD